MGKEEQEVYPQYKAWIDVTRNGLGIPSEEEITELLASKAINRSSVWIHIEAYGDVVETANELTYIFIENGYVYNQDEFDEVYSLADKIPWYASKREFPARIPKGFDDLAKLFGFEYKSQYFGYRQYRYKATGEIVGVDENTFPALYEISFRQDNAKVFTVKDYAVFLAKHGIEEAHEELRKERFYKINLVTE